MFFCENPKCFFHVEVSKFKYQHTIPFQEPTVSLTEEIFPYNLAITREKHLWENPKKGTKWFFCDVCHEAALITTQP